MSLHRRAGGIKLRSLKARWGASAWPSSPRATEPPSPSKPPKPLTRDAPRDPRDERDKTPLRAW